ncbi:hypothetical protein [Bosea sp. LjRoot237]|uniref:hypothetical protein n=1 Tax=Bosea sp. LjRoot237 TaxID=3342292 RepID=UPI003ECD32F7
MLDVFGVAEEIQARFSQDNVAFEDITTMIARLGAQSGCALELDADAHSPGTSVVYSG